MRVRASTDDDGLRWKHAVWNVIPCSSFLILRCCSSHLSLFSFSPLLWTLISPNRPAMANEEGVTDVTTIYAWNRRRISNGGSSNGSVVFAYSDDAGEGGGAVRREDQGRDAAIDYRAGERYLPEYTGRSPGTATDARPAAEAGGAGRPGVD